MCYNKRMDRIETDIKWLRWLMITGFSLTKTSRFIHTDKLNPLGLR